MAERKIPIKIQRDTDEKESISDESDENDQSNKMSQTMEQLAIKPGTKQKKLSIQIKSSQENMVNQKYLREYDVFEDRSKGTLFNGNVREKIILAIDRAQDENCTPFMTEKSKFTPLSMFRRSLHLFLKLKHLINKDNEFALVVLNENSAKWHLNFTNDLRKLNQEIERITQCDVEDTFNMNNLLQEISHHVQVPETDSDEIAPTFVIRTILLYGRSYTIPVYKPDINIETILKKPYFYFDVLFTHEPVDRSNNCNNIFEALQSLDKKGLSYFFPVCRDTRRLHNSMAKLLAHPLQRPIQKLHKF
ncbi:unnamed protein product [Phaedon cochleariae]|uniref:BRISC and BRCA1-A complex member 1 n=1 Tax=Phaedon cochleariae TaxID=80249 RepID=A0A9P0GND9_PHACE|nr:unnamed protein product [Phaedon cochleariae]